MLFHIRAIISKSISLCCSAERVNISTTWHKAHKLILDEEELGKVNTIVSVSESWSLCPGAEIGQIEIFVNKQQQQLQELNIGVDCQNNDDWSYLVFTEHIIVWFVVSWCCWRVLFVESIMVGSSSPGCILELVSSSWQWYCSGHDHSRLWFVVQLRRLRRSLVTGAVRCWSGRQWRRMIRWRSMVTMIRRRRMVTSLD